MNASFYQLDEDEGPVKAGVYLDLSTADGEAPPRAYKLDLDFSDYTFVGLREVKFVSSRTLQIEVLGEVSQGGPQQATFQVTFDIAADGGPSEIIRVTQV